MTMRSSDREFVVHVGNADMAAERLEGHRVRVGDLDAVFDVEPCGSGEYVVRDGVHAWRVFVSGPPETRRVFVDGMSVVVEVMPAGRSAARPRRQDFAASAPMPATVLEILVTVGQAVNIGDVLLKLEAMKMEMPVRAPRPGTVAAVRCAEGDLVQPGVVLVDIT
jgi:biotin carboxyl carrier protein